MKNIIFLEGQNSNSDFTKAKDYFFFYKAALEVGNNLMTFKATSDF